MEVSIYIKSHFRGNPRGSGEAAAIVEFIDRRGEVHTRQQAVRTEYGTRNALYLKICIAAMHVLIKPCDAIVYIDCEYVKNSCQLGRLDKWRKDGWKKTNGKPPANVEDWKQFYMLTQIHTIRFAPYNSRYDAELEKMLGGGT